MTIKRNRHLWRAVHPFLWHRVLIWRWCAAQYPGINFDAIPLLLVFITGTSKFICLFQELFKLNPVEKLSIFGLLFCFFCIYLKWFANQHLPECIFSSTMCKGRQRAWFSYPHISFAMSWALISGLHQKFQTSLPRIQWHLLALADIHGHFN